MEPINVNLASETLTGKRHAPAAKAAPAADEATTAGTVERVTLRVILYAVCAYSVFALAVNGTAPTAAVVFAVTLAGLACSARG